MTSVVSSHHEADLKRLLSKHQATNPPNALGWNLIRPIEPHGSTPKGLEFDDSDSSRTFTKGSGGIVKSFFLYAGSRPPSDCINSSKRRIDVYELCRDPKIWLYKNFLTSRECDAILREAETIGYVPSATSLGKAYSQPDSYVTAASKSRTSYSASFRDVKSPLVECIEKRCTKVLDADITHMEPVTVLRYEPGQQFKIHHDGDFRPRTMLIYLNDVLAGGETEFPSLGLVQKPERGAAVAWDNALSNGKADMRVLHAGLPVIEGVKYAIPVFFNQNPMRIYY